MRVIHFAEKKFETESRCFIPICLPDRRSFQQHHTPIDKCMNFMVRGILWKRFIQIFKEQPANFMEPEFSLQCSQMPTTGS